MFRTGKPNPQGLPEGVQMYAELGEVCSVAKIYFCVLEIFNIPYPHVLPRNSFHCILQVFVLPDLQQICLKVFGQMV